MRHPIEKSPRDGTTIILEDDASGTYDVAHWSTEAGEWVGENGEPTKITPTHWYPMPRDQYLLREDERSRNQSRGGRARRLRAASRAVDIAPIVRELQAAGKTSLRAIAAGLNDAGIPTARGHGTWSAVQVQRVLGRL